MGVRYWDLLASIPFGGFYHKDVVPFKAGTYAIVIDTVYPLTEYDVSVNEVVYQLKTDVSGLIQLYINLTQGVNTLKWRRAGAALWKWREVEASNIGVVLSGLSAGMEEIDADILKVTEGASVLTAVSMAQWKYLYGIADTVITKEQLEEIVQALWNFSEREKVIRQVSGAIEDIPVSLKRVGSFILGSNWVYNGKYSEGVDGYEILNEVSANVLTGQTDFGNVLRVVGDSSVEIYPFVHYGDEARIGRWTFKVWVKWTGVGSGKVQIGTSVDGLSWVWSTAYNVIGVWDALTIHTVAKPLKVGIKFNTASVDFSVNFGWVFLINESVNLTLPQEPGAWEGRKAVAVWSWLP